MKAKAVKSTTKRGDRDELNGEKRTETKKNN